MPHLAVAAQRHPVTTAAVAAQRHPVAMVAEAIAAEVTAAVVVHRAVVVLIRQQSLSWHKLTGKLVLLIFAKVIARVNTRPIPALSLVGVL